MNHSPLVIYPERTIALPPRYCGDVDYYALMAKYGSAVIDFSMPYNRRAKECHRCEIEGANGVQRLTVPLEKGPSGSIAGLRVSDHGEWWNVHWGAIYSAYGRTPYFEYYADDFLPAFQGCVKSLMELDTMLDTTIRRILGITTQVTYRTTQVPSPLSTPPSPLFPLHSSLSTPPTPPTPPYYQVWGSRFGFIPRLSILDLIFNLGPESPLILRSPK